MINNLRRYPSEAQNTYVATASFPRGYGRSKTDETGNFIVRCSHEIPVAEIGRPKIKCGSTDNFEPGFFGDCGDVPNFRNFAKLSKPGILAILAILVIF